MEQFPQTHNEEQPRNPEKEGSPTYENYLKTIEHIGAETTPEELDAFRDEIKSKFDNQKPGDEWHISLLEAVQLENKIMDKKTELESK